MAGWKSGSRGFTLTELMVVIGIAALLLPLVILAVEQVNEKDDRTACAANLRRIGLAILMYANENRDQYPRTTYNPAPDAELAAFTGAGMTDPFDRDEAKRPAQNDVTAALFLLLRTQDIDAEAFICPATEDVADDYLGRDGTGTGNVGTRSNFSSSDNLSYSYSNPYPKANAVGAGYVMNTSRGRNFALMSDRAHDRAESGRVAADAPPEVMREKGNSRNHDGEGQNVLYGDGSVRFAATVFAGGLRGHTEIRDNIFAGQDPERNRTGGGGDEWPTDAEDSVMVPAR